jgi:hypothetical protein
MDHIEQPADCEKTDDNPEWCKYHGGGKHNTDGCMAAKDDIAAPQGRLPPPVVANRLLRDNKLKTHKARAKHDKSNFRKVSFSLYSLPLNDI